MIELLPFLNKEPYTLPQKEKEGIFLSEIKKAAVWHYENCPAFKTACINKNFDVFSDFELNDLPYFPTSIFKEFDLLSVPKEKVVKTLYSSSTSGKPSKIMLDQETASRQTAVLGKIWANFFGQERKNFVVFDTEATVKSNDGELSSRGTAIRGILPMVKKLSFVLNQNLELSSEKLQTLKALSCESKTCYFGFTWLVYNICLNGKGSKDALEIFKKLSGQDGLLLHTGGWKKFQDIALSKNDFNLRVAEALGLKKEKINDFYGLTEQLGTIYPDCDYGYKHAPVYSEIIIRDFDTLLPADAGRLGFIQFISPLPHSYPGISLLTDDIGKIIGTDDCKCGRKGKYFIFEKRSEKAELKGCGDTLKVKA